MADEPKKPTFTPRKGFLADRPTKRLGKKSPFLKKLERAQLSCEFVEADLRIIGMNQTPPTPPSNVLPLDQSKRRER